jgi:hypothetical protein
MRPHVSAVAASMGSIRWSNRNSRSFSIHSFSRLRRRPVARRSTPCRSPASVMTLCVQFIGDVSFNRIQPYHRRCNTREPEHIIGADSFDIDAECSAVELAGQQALGAKSQAFVPHSVVLDFGLFRNSIHFEAHEIAECLSSGFLKIGKYDLR